MTCPRCQTNNPPQAKFCLECATPLVARCANCATATTMLGDIEMEFWLEKAAAELAARR